MSWLMSKVKVTTKQNNSGKRFTGSLFVRLLILLLIITGILFWFPAFFHYLGRRSMEISHLHITLGLILIVAGIVFLFKQKRDRASSTQDNKNQRSGVSVILLRACLLFLALTGLGLTFSQMVPRKTLMVLIYLHGTGAFFLIVGFVITGFQRIAEKLVKPSPPVETDTASNCT
jgi:membrane protease YdiL (CAAX protease family)